MEAVSSTLDQEKADLGVRGKTLGASGRGAKFTCEVRMGGRSLWVLAKFAGRAGVAFRTAHTPEGELECVGFKASDNTLAVDLVSPVGSWRVQCEFPTEQRNVLHYTVWLTPTQPLKIPFWPRDICPFGPAFDPTQTQGLVHTSQRGLRTGALFASMKSPPAGTFLYVQNFGALNDFSQATKTAPTDRIGGSWPELGYSPAPNPEHPLQAANEIVFSDAFVAWDPEIPLDDRAQARMYLDLLAQIYFALPRPEPEHHNWPLKATETVRDLAFSPQCTYMRQGRRYLNPYVGDDEKPPESMVQLTVALALLEYETWSNQHFVLTERLLEGISSFFVPEVGCCLRWLPGEKFGDTGEEGQKHENMDSWYLYHILFNMSRLAALGNTVAMQLFAKSLPYAMRVARRFDYEFPIFFDVNSLAVVRAESKPGAGGERDVAGLYACVMLHAYSLLGDSIYLAEAKKAAGKLRGLGFKLSYQLNTTGFAAEALLQLFLITGEEEYLEYSYVCLANIFDNMSIWEANYGYARQYHTFFGLFPLRDAPYTAPYEELEALAKFQNYLRIGHSLLRPSVRRLIAEYCKHMLGRAWHYYPANLPADGLAAKSRNGRIVPSLAIPLEDLQDGYAQSGQVGQEIYGSGLALVCTTRHFKPVTAGVQLFCEYPLIKFKVGTRSCRFAIGGEGGMNARVRLIPTDPSLRPPAFTLRAAGAKKKQVFGAQSSEGHLVFEVPGGSELQLTWSSRERSTRSHP